MEEKLQRGIKVNAGDVRGMVFGGPFKQYEPGTRRLIGVKMAAEINHPHEISIPTHDFSIPDPDAMTMGLKEALSYMADGNDIYVGCMGGIGRTGLFMGVLVKCLADYDGKKVDPVKVVREQYKSHAIETNEQQVFVRTFNTEPVVKHLMQLNARKIQYVERGWFSYMSRFFGMGG